MTPSPITRDALRREPRLLAALVGEGAARDVAGATRDGREATLVAVVAWAKACSGFPDDDEVRQALTRCAQERAWRQAGEDRIIIARANHQDLARAQRAQLRCPVRSFGRQRHRVGTAKAKRHTTSSRGSVALKDPGGGGGDDPPQRNSDDGEPASSIRCAGTVCRGPPGEATGRGVYNRRTFHRCGAPGKMEVSTK